MLAAYRAGNLLVGHKCIFDNRVVALQLVVGLYELGLVGASVAGLSEFGYVKLLLCYLFVDSFFVKNYGNDYVVVIVDLVSAFGGYNVYLGTANRFCFDNLCFFSCFLCFLSDRLFSCSLHELTV